MSSEAPTPKPTLLLIEDNPGDARLMRELLAEGAAGAFELEHAERLASGRQRLLQGGVALVLLDLSLPDGDGLCVWIPVKSEQFALVTLAARGIVVLPGQMCTTSDGQHIRVSTSLLNDGIDGVADAIALSEC